MGWTHNWQRETELPKDRFARAVRDCQKVLKHIAVPLGGFDGSGEPVFNDDVIVFNGANGGACEPFEFHQTEFDRRGRKVIWSFCKTEHSSYDRCVQAALIVLKHHLGDLIKVGSDGTDEDWSEARKACQTCLGYGDDFRLEKSES